MTTANKAPAYQWYPRDHAADELVQLMTLEEEGAYRRLLDHQWLHGSIPADVVQLAKICKNMTLPRMGRIWKALAPCFVAAEGAGDRLWNRRLERVRTENREYKERQSAAGKQGAEARWGPKRGDGDRGGRTDGVGDGDRMAGAWPGDSSASASASASAVNSCSDDALHHPAGAAQDDSTEPEQPHTRSSVLGLVVARLYFGRRPSEPDMATNASILAQLQKRGRSWDELARVVEGLAQRRDRGELKSVPKDRPVSLKWLNDADQQLNQLAVSEDAYYRDGADGRAERHGGAAQIGEILRGARTA